MTIATCGRTSFTSGRISPGWFMPISKMPKLVSCRHPGESQRHAPLVVEGADRRMRRADLREDEAEHLLRAGLSDRSGDGDDRPAHACARSRRRPARGRPAGRRERRAAGHRLPVRGLRRRSPVAAPAFRAVCDEVVAVAVLAVDGDEGFARFDRAAVDRDAGDRCRRIALAAVRLRRRRMPRSSTRSSRRRPRAPSALDAPRLGRRKAAPCRRRSARSRGLCRR